MFCHALIDNEGLGFIDHIALTPDCADAYESWLEHLDEDRGGG